jgi:predicted dehydrogenase
MPPVRWGLLSTAHINRRLIPALQASPRAELVAVASRSQATAAAYAAHWGIPRAFGSYQALLDSAAIDAVYISLPNHLHSEWAIKALTSGKHVLCEKPFALSLEETDRMIDAAARSGCVLAEAFMYRHHPQMKALGRWLREGRLGEVSLVRAVFNFTLTDAHNIRLRPETGGGALWDIGVYPLSFAQFVMGGPPVRVAAEQRLGETGVDVVFAGQMVYANGGIAQISASFNSPFYSLAEVYGSLGRLTLNRPFVLGADGTQRQLLFHPNEGPPQPIPFVDRELYGCEIEDFHDAILAGAAPYLSLAETRNHIATVLALYRAARGEG